MANHRFVWHISVVKSDNRRLTVKPHQVIVQVENPVNADDSPVTDR